LQIDTPVKNGSFESILTDKDILGSCQLGVAGKAGPRMAPRKKDIYKKPKKICWHLYSLQILSPEKFIKVINKILRREFSVIK
jgi:hypothetical protein